MTAAAADYSGVVREALLAHKEHSRRSARPALAALLAAAVDGVLSSAPRDVLLVPVPSSPAAVRARGGDPVHAMTCAAAALLTPDGHQVRVLRGLVQLRTPDDQAGLTSEQRALNLEGALVVKPAAMQRLLNSQVIVVDDVCTTGATLREAARALQSAGVAEPRAAVVAATVRRGVSSEHRVPTGDTQVGEAGLSSEDRSTQTWNVPI